MSDVTGTDSTTMRESIRLEAFRSSQPLQPVSEELDTVVSSPSQRSDTADRCIATSYRMSWNGSDIDEAYYMDPQFHDGFMKRDISRILCQLDNDGWNNLEGFFDPVDPHRLSLVHVAAYAGRRDILEHVLELYVTEPTVFTIGTNDEGTDPWLATDKFGRCALHYAAFEGHADVVRWILDLSSTRHPQISLEDVFGRTPLHDAVARLNVDVVKLLVENGAAVNVPKHWIPSFLSLGPEKILDYTLCHGDAPQRYYDIVKFLLEKSTEVSDRVEFNINYCDPKTGWTMLTHAITLKSHKTVKYLVERGADPNLSAADAGWKKAWPERIFDFICKRVWDTRPAYPSCRYGLSALQYAACENDFESIRILVNNGGNLAKPYLASSGTTIDNLRRGTDDLVVENFLTDLFDAQLESEYTFDIVVVNYNILAPQDDPRNMAVILDLMKAMPRKGLYKILKHPLLQLYIRKQWSQLSGGFYIFLMLHICFVILLSWYTIDLVNNISDPDVRLTTAMYSIAIFLFFKNWIQFLTGSKWFLIRRVTWLLCLSLMLSMVVAVNAAHTSHAPKPWVLHVLSLVLPLSWIQMLQFFGQLVFPPWGHYALLLYIVLKSVLKVLAIGLVVVLGFSLSFFILFHNNDQFDHPLKAVAKTIVMMTGEYEYGDLFGTNATKSLTDRNPIFDDLPLVTGRIVFIVFVMITSIVLMNLMIALAVTDVQTLVGKGEFERLRNQAMFIAHWEQTRLLSYFKRCLRKTRSESPTMSNFDKFYPYKSRPSRISAEVWREIITFHEKNKPSRQQSKGTESHTDNIHVTLATMQASLESIKNQLHQLIQDRNADVK